MSYTLTYLEFYLLYWFKIEEKEFSISYVKMLQS